MFGETFKYNKVFLGKLETGDVITLEEFIDGKFDKYINNDGQSCSRRERVIVKKAECLVHFSFESSKKELMIVDIQGCHYTLCDPEIASKSHFSDDNEFLFSARNLSVSQ